MTINIILSKSILRWELIILILSIPVIPYIKDLTKLKINKDGIEFEKLKDDSSRVIKSFIKGDVIAYNDIEILYASVETNDWAKLTMTRMLMRNAFARLLPDHAFGPSPSLSELINLAKKRKIINKKEIEQLEKIRNITYYAEWWSGGEPTISEWNWALKNAKGIIIKLFSKINN